MKTALQQALFATLCLSLSALAHARTDTATALLADFFGELQTFSADFAQQVFDDNDREIDASEGRMWIKRPGMFRWNYLKPFSQQIVADGERLWSYDKDLEQVTVQAADEVLTATPAMLLSGNRPLEDVFEITGSNGRSVLLKPKNADSNVTSLELTFNDNGLEQIRAADTFGNTTVFTFSNVRRNPLLDQQLFRFEPPPGADVVGNHP